MAGGGASTTVGDGAVRLMRELRRPRAMEEGGWACAAWGGFSGLWNQPASFNWPSEILARHTQIGLSLIASLFLGLQPDQLLTSHRQVVGRVRLVAAPTRALVLAVLLAIAVANAEAASIVVGLAKCADCTRNNIKAGEAFKGLQVAIKCKNIQGEYESKALGALDGTGAFSVPLAADLHGADRVAQLHSAASNAPCSGQEPPKIVPVSERTTFGVVAGAKTDAMASLECASATLCGTTKKHIIEHFHHKQPVPPKPEPKPQPHPDYGPVPKPEPKPQPHPDYHPVPPTPSYGGVKYTTLYRKSTTNERWRPPNPAFYIKHLYFLVSNCR
nr:proline-rich protein 4-like [Aegilops tauschii subsp. strangulata]